MRGRVRQGGHLFFRENGPQALVDGAMLGVDGHDLGARRSSGPAWTTGPPAIRDSLLARASRHPPCRAASVTGNPANPTTPLTTTSTPVAISARAPGPDEQLDAGW